MNISKRIEQMAASATLAMSQRSSEMKAAGIDIIDLSVGETDFNTPDFVKQAAHNAIDENYSFYTPVKGYPSLRSAICGKLKRENHLDYVPDQIICSNGAKQSIYNALMVLLDEGDEAVIPAPYWVSYPEMVKLAGGKPVIVKGEGECFKMTPRQLEAAITPRTKVLILCSPCNPTGARYNHKELEQIARVVREHNIFVISDEVYEDLCYNEYHPLMPGCERDYDSIDYFGYIHQSITSEKDMQERVAVVNSVSKSYAMTGWRLGWLAGPKWLVDACAKLQGQTTGAPSSIAQKAAEAAYSGNDSWNIKNVFCERRNLVADLLTEIPLLECAESPRGAFYVFPNCEKTFGRTFNGVTINNSQDLAMYLLEHAHVASVAGSAFGAEGYIRFSFATSKENIREGFRRIKEALA